MLYPEKKHAKTVQTKAIKVASGVLTNCMTVSYAGTVGGIGDAVGANVGEFVGALVTLSKILATLSSIASKFYLCEAEVERRAVFLVQELFLLKGARKLDTPATESKIMT